MALVIPTEETCKTYVNYARKNNDATDTLYTTWDATTGAIDIRPYKPPYDYPMTIYTAQAQHYNAHDLLTACRKFADKWERH